MFVYNYLATQTNILFSGGNYMKIKIVNKNKFIRTCVIIFISVICMIFFGFNNAYSKENIKYKEQYIYQGDTLWSIAQKESKCNQYYKNKDRRDNPNTNILKELY